MRDLWIALANESAGMSERVLLNEIADLDKMQSGLERRGPDSNHANNSRDPGERRFQ
jgi:hypothetical protein